MERAGDSIGRGAGGGIWVVSYGFFCWAEILRGLDWAGHKTFCASHSKLQKSSAGTNFCIFRSACSSRVLGCHAGSDAGNDDSASSMTNQDASAGLGGNAGKAQTMGTNTNHAPAFSTWTR